MSTNYADIQVGDRVRIDKYVIGRLTECPCDDDKVIGQTGIVIEKLDRGHFNIRLYVRLTNFLKCDPVIRVFEIRDKAYELVSLVEKGNGHARAGIEYPLTESELREQRWLNYLRLLDLENRDFTHQGWSNAATWMANQYLTNHKPAMDQVPALIRKDGTINPGRLMKLYLSSRAPRLDDWVFDPPVERPGEFAHYRIPGLDSKTRINWQEIADDIAESHKKERQHSGLIIHPVATHKGSQSCAPSI